MGVDPLALAAVIVYCGWDPTESLTGAVAVLDGTGTGLLTLPSLAVTAVSAVTVTDQAGPRSLTVGPGADVEWSDNGCLNWTRCGCWPAGNGNVSVTYDSGYPPDGQDRANIAAVIGSITKRLPAMSGAVSKRLLSGSITYSASAIAGELLMIERMVLDGYRIAKAR